MKNTFAIRFYCRKTNARKDGKAPVECSIIIRGERVLFQLPKRCEPEKFKSLKPSNDIMIYIHNVENKLNEIYTTRSLANEPVSPFILKDIYLNGSQAATYTLENLFDDGIALKSDSSVELINKYNNLKRLFFEFTGFSPSKPADTVTRNDILKLIPKLEKVHCAGTVVKDIQRYRYFWSTAFAAGKIKSTPFINIRYSTPRQDNIFLTQEEVDAIRKLRLTNQRLENARDVFLFLCYTGLEYADLIELRPEDIQTSKTGQKYIKKNRIKTDIEYISVLYEDAVGIIDYYNGELPICSNQKLNESIKKLATMAGITKTVTTLTARHTYATYLLSTKKLSMDIVSKMLGHTTTRQTYTYAKLLDETVLNENAKASAGTPTSEQVYIPDKDLRDFQEILGSI